MQRTRREFLTDVGKGMVIASIGSELALDLGLGWSRADTAPQSLTFGTLEPLVGLMQDTPPAKLLPLVTRRLQDGTPLEQVVAAAALANARTFGGEDYVGFHTLMALSPAYHMARELPAERQALPVLKVLYRNSNRIQEKGGRKSEVLHPVAATHGSASGEVLREQARHKDLAGAEATFAALANGPAEDALDHLLVMVEDATEVHRVVLAYRAYDLLSLVGKERAHTMLRQSVHYCIQAESPQYIQSMGRVRTILPQLLDQHHLAGRAIGTRTADDAWVEHLSRAIFEGTPESAADAVAAALAEGFAPAVIGEAISLAANQLVLRDNGRPKAQAQPNKPIGSVHGDGIGVHACDSANAWRNLARVGTPRHTMAGLILGAYQVAYDRVNRGGDFLGWEPYPRADARAQIKTNDPAALLREADAAIRSNNQALASAAVHRYGKLGQSPRPVFDLMLKYAISEDGALHAEKYYRTVAEEFAATRPAFRWRQLVALARVTASEYGQPAPGYADACRLLQV